MGHIVERLNVTKDWEQGFVDSYGEFLTRSEAMDRARGLRQLKHSTTAEELYSEDLY